MHQLCKILNTPVMSICLVKQNDGTWVEKHQRFYSTFTNVFNFVTFFKTIFNVFFLKRFYVYGLRPSVLGQDRSETKKTLLVLVLHAQVLGLGLAGFVLCCETQS